jgi:hypothetical protein
MWCSVAGFDGHVPASLEALVLGRERKSQKQLQRQAETEYCLEVVELQH